jgi:hypothetical protein
MLLKLIAKTGKARLQRRHRPWGKRAEGSARRKVPGHLFKQSKVSVSSLANVDRVEDLFNPRQAITAGCAPAARFLREEVLQIRNESNWTGLIIKNDRAPCAEPVTACGKSIHAHGRIQITFEHKSG